LNLYQYFGQKKLKDQAAFLAPHPPFIVTSDNRQSYVSAYGYTSPLCIYQLAIFENARKWVQKTGNLFLISCFSVSFHVVAVIQLSCEPDSVCPSVVPCLNYIR